MYCGRHNRRNCGQKDSFEVLEGVEVMLVNCPEEIWLTLLIVNPEITKFRNLGEMEQ